MDDSSNRFELVELFMAKAGRHGWDRCFHGIIRRETDIEGNPVVIGKIKVNDEYIIASASDQWKLGEKLDEMVLFVLDKKFHEDKK
jgi:hypothetical protein